MSDNSIIFILYSCNEWKEYSSMHTIAASTNIGDIYKVVKNEIRKGNMDYDCLSKHDGVKKFDEVLANGRLNKDLLEYGYIEELENIAVVNSRKTKRSKRA